VEVDAMGKWMLILMVTMLFAGAGVNEARAADSPTITISPNSGSCDQPVTISVAGFGDAWVNVMVGPVGVAPQIPAYELLYYDAPPDGTFTFVPNALWWPLLCGQFAAPAMRVIATTTQDVEAGEIDTVVAETTFTKTREDAPTSGPRIVLSPNTGECDEPITVHGSGFRSGASVQISIAPLVILPGSGGGGLGEDTTTTVRTDGSFAHTVATPTVQDSCNKYFSNRIGFTAAEAKGVPGSIDTPPVRAEFYRTRQLNGGGNVHIYPTPTPVPTEKASKVHNSPGTLALAPAAAPTVRNTSGDDGNQALEVVVTVVGALAAAAATLFVARQT
jgi:hypothetical protein